MDTVQFGPLNLPMYVAVGGALLLLGLIPAILALLFRGKWKDVQRQNATTVGVYMGNRLHELQFGYRVNGKVYALRLPARNYGGLLSYRRGQRVMVCYDPGNPSQSSLAGRTAFLWKLQYILFAVVGALTLVAALAILIIAP